MLNCILQDNKTVCVERIAWSQDRTVPGSGSIQAGNFLTVFSRNIMQHAIASLHFSMGI